MRPGLRAILFPPYCAEAKALFAAFTVRPSPQRKASINALIVALKGYDLWPKLDLFYVKAAHDSQAAGLNWKAPASFALTPTNSPTFTTDRGYTGNGSSMYLATGWDAATNGVNFVQDAASIGVWSLTQGQMSGNMIGNSAAQILMNPRTTGDLFASRVNNSSSVNRPSTDGRGLFVASRISSSTIRAFINGVYSGQSTGVTSLAPSSTDIDILRASSFSNGQCALAFVGGSLTDTDVANLYTATLAYMQAVGAA